MEKIFVDFFIYFQEFLFNASEKEPDCYHQKVKTGVASLVFTRLKTQDLEKLEKLKKAKGKF